MPTSPAELLKEYFDHWQEGRPEQAEAMWHEDVVLHYPGRHRFAGLYRNKAKVLEYLSELDRRGGDEVVEVFYILGNETYAAVSYREDVTIDGHTQEFRRFNSYRFEAGIIVEIWVFEEDPYAVDEFFNAYA